MFICPRSIRINMDRCIYFDNAGTTQMLPEVLDDMMPYFLEKYGNPSSIHDLGSDAAAAVRLGRKRVAKALGCYSSEITFTSGGTESDNIALIGTAGREGRNRIVTTATEHSAVLETCIHLKKQGFEVDVVKVHPDGTLDMDDLNQKMGDDVSLLSVMTANNVIGTIQNIRECSRIAHEHGALFHTDAVQGFTKTDVDVRKNGIDLLSISGHKIHGPKGIGVLYVREGLDINPITFGGGQERGLRPSTENVPGIVGLGKASEMAMATMESDVRKMTEIRDTIIESVLEIEGSALNGTAESRLCNNAHFRFDGVRGTDLVLRLSSKGIMASTASACSAGDTEPSHVLSAIGLNVDQALSALRITLSHLNTVEDAEYLAEVLPSIVKECRQ